MVETIKQYNHIKTLEDLIQLSNYATTAISIVRENMVSDPGHDESHLIRVTRDALGFANGKGNTDVIIVSAILHDLVNVPKDRPHRSSASLLSANKAHAELLKVYKHEHQEELLSSVHHAIHAHSFSAKIRPTTIEARCIQDADRIEALGFIGISRLFSVGGSLGRQLWHPTDPLAQNRELDELTYTLDHVSVKLGKLHKTMQTKIGGTVAEHRTADMATFIYNIMRQLDGLPSETVGYLSDADLHEAVGRFVFGERS